MATDDREPAIFGDEDVRRDNAEGVECHPKITEPRDWRFFNVIILGVAFLLMFTSFQTCSMVEETVLEGAKNETNGTFSGSGFTSLAVIYSSFAVCNWVAPSIISVCGAKISMMIGGVIYTLFIASFLKPMNWSLYLGSVLLGFAAAIIWTGQGNCLTLNSDVNTMARNSGIFWALLQCSLLFGNLYIYFAFAGEIQISDDTRMTVFTVLTAVSIVGVLSLLLIRKPGPPRSGLTSGESVNRDEEEKDGPLKAFKTAVSLMGTKQMLLLSVLFAYTGFELTFFSGVYTTTVGHTQAFGDSAKRLMGICGMFIGAGEILGGGVFGLLGKYTNRYGRDPIVLLGLIVHLIAFYLIFLNFPFEAPVEESTTHAYITSNKYVAIVCAFLLGLGDASMNTQIFSILGTLYQSDSAPAFALYKFVQSLAAAIAFFYSSYLVLQWQLLILVVFGVVGSWTFFIVEWRSSGRRGGYEEI